MLKKLSSTELREGAAALREKNPPKRYDISGYYRRREIAEMKKKIERLSPAELNQMIDFAEEIRFSKMLYVWGGL